MCIRALCLCMGVGINQGIHSLWGKHSLHAYGYKFYIHLGSQVGNLEGIAFFFNTRFIIYKTFGTIYFSCTHYTVFLLVVPYVVLVDTILCKEPRLLCMGKPMIITINILLLLVISWVVFHNILISQMSLFPLWFYSHSPHASDKEFKKPSVFRQLKKRTFDFQEVRG